MNCNYQISQYGKKRILCPSAAHGGLPLGALKQRVLGDWTDKDDTIVMFCSHHEKVVFAKLTNSQKMEVNEYGQFKSDEREVASVEREVADEHLDEAAID